LIYQKDHTKKGALKALLLSTLCTSAVAAVLNATVIFPMYEKLYGMPMDKIIAMVSKVNRLAKDYITTMIFAVFPFNLVKFGLTSLITYVMYKKTGNVLRSLIRE
jgi:riboflavin transporter FmnP